MTLAERLLPRLSEWRPAGAGRHTWSEALGGWAVHLAADKAESLSCLAWELTLARTGDAPDGLTVKDWAAGVTDRVTGLLEGLELYEVDTTRDEAVLRSETPSTRGGRLGYYEVHLFGTAKAVVRRFAADKAVPGREQVPFALTHEVLAKLAGDVAGE